MPTTYTPTNGAASADVPSDRVKWYGTLSTSGKTVTNLTPVSTVFADSQLTRTPIMNSKTTKTAASTGHPESEVLYELTSHIHGGRGFDDMNCFARVYRESANVTARREGSVIQSQEVENAGEVTREKVCGWFENYSPDVWGSKIGLASNGRDGGGRVLEGSDGPAFWVEIDGEGAVPVSLAVEVRSGLGGEVGRGGRQVFWFMSASG